MKKGFKKLLVSLGLGVMFILGTTAAVSAATEGELKAFTEPQSTRELVFDNSEASVPEALVGYPTTSVQTAATTTSIALKWNSVSDATRYRIYIGPYKATSSKSFKNLGTTTRNYCTIKDLKPGTPYSVRILAENSRETAKYYLRRDCVTLYDTIKINRLSFKDGRFTFQMKPNSSYNFISGYRVTFTCYKTGKVFNRYYTNATTFATTPLDGSFYRLYIRPYIVMNGKRYICPASAVKYVAQQPKLYKKGYTRSSMTVGWNKVAGATSYTVFIKYPGSSTYKKVKTTGALTYTLTGMKPNRDYYIKVIANRRSAHSPSNVYYQMRLKTY